MAKVSVILPIYNVEKYLQQCLDSIINQTLDDIEIICIDDGSPDNCLEILNEYKARDNRFVVISKENEGQGVARNLGIEIAKGEYVSFIDPDDWIEHSMLEDMYNAAIINNANVVQCDRIQYFEDEKFYRVGNPYKKLEEGGFAKPNSLIDLVKINKNVLRGYYNGPAAKLYKTSFLRENDIKFLPYRKGEDQAFSIEVKISTPIFHINNGLYYYRVRSTSARSYQTIYDPIAEAVTQVVTKYGLQEYLREALDDYVAERYFLKFKHLYGKNINKFLSEHKDKLNDNQIEHFMAKICKNDKLNFVKKLFSIITVKNSGKRHKIITILGIKLKIRLSDTPVNA